jgi:hypothetical protein
MLLRGAQWLLFMNQILHLANPHDKLSALCVSKSWVLMYSLTNFLGSKTRTSLSFHMQDRGFGMENMSFDGLGLLFGVIEIHVVLHILIHGLRFPVLQCDIFTYYVSILIHSPYTYLKCEITLVLT